MRFDKARLGTGLRIHYAESGEARGIPVVFVHGWPDSWFSFSRVLPLLPATLRLIAFDQRGFGESDHPDSGYTIPGFAADLVAFLDALDIERAVLVGHSYGTFVARRAAITMPERVVALTLIGTGASTKIAGADDLQAAVRELPEIQGVWRTSGDLDYLLKARVADVRAYDRLYQRLIRKVELADISASFVMEEIKETTELPVDLA